MAGKQELIVFNSTEPSVEFKDTHSKSRIKDTNAYFSFLSIYFYFLLWTGMWVFAVGAYLRGRYRASFPFIGFSVFNFFSSKRRIQ